jgi:hypothetical protein
MDRSITLPSLLACLRVVKAKSTASNDNVNQLAPWRSFVVSSFVVQLGMVLRPYAHVVLYILPCMGTDPSVGPWCLERCGQAAVYSSHSKL